MKAPHTARYGTYSLTIVKGETVRAFLPPPIPSLRVEGLQKLLEEANQALGRLDALVQLLAPSERPFLSSYLRKEAILSCQIAGARCTLLDLLLLEMEEDPVAPLSDVRRVSAYMAALNRGITQLRDGHPLSLPLIRQIHEQLLAADSSSDKDRGEFRRTQTWIAGTRAANAEFVPPPPKVVLECMVHLEEFLMAERQEVPPLIKAGMAHVQFETIHPFLDGNGRLGRLLIALLLCTAGALREPTLYLSLFLQSNCARYCDLLANVRATGDWEAWMEFFLTGVKEISEQGVKTALRIMRLFDADRIKIESLGRAAPSVFRVFRLAQTNPVLSVPAIAEKTGVSFPTASAAVEHLNELGLFREITGRQRRRLFAYEDYLRILSEGTEPGA